jgi:hypothetical protein
MALLTNSYGDVDEIAALVPRYANSVVEFDTSTRPSLLQVESHCDQVSAMLNAVLATNGFAIPVTDADAVLLLDLFVNQEVASIAEGINGSGRFGPTKASSSASPGGRFALIMADVESFVENNALGLERLGATRTYDPIAGISFRSGDEGGDDTAPIFQRDAFGNKFKDWDS